MKQLTIFCSRDLENRVVATLDAAGVEGFVRIGDVTGAKFLPAGEVPRSVTWEAVMFVVPAAPAERVRDIVAELERYAQDCEIQPCLRTIVTGVESVG